MKPGGYTLHHSLTLESASVVKHAIALAQRRGHAQVTPLHMATALLGASPASTLLKRACLQSHSHPLQCKALELCFNVALNRLPTSASSSPLVVASGAPAHYHVPSLSNALVAAFKRAQAHQRRGSIESHNQQQQQSVLALKVEIEQLVVSILDDPSVSRVMREAGFSSTQVKSNVEKTVSSRRSPPASSQPKQQPNHLALTVTEPPTGRRPALNDDVATVLDAMMDRKTKNGLTIVSDSVSTAEAVVKEVIETFNKKDVPPGMRLVQFISVPLSTLKNISRDEFETRLEELRSLVKSCMNRGVVLYLGDLNWVATFWSQRDHGYYCPIEYMIMELSRMICGNNDDDNKRLLWLMGTATPETYAKCRIGRPSLETLWCLHSLRLRPVIGNLALNLSLDSTGMYDRIKEEADFNWYGIKKQLHCCIDCSNNFKKEAQSVITSAQQRKTGLNSSLPSWLQQYMVENRKHDNVDQECDKIKDLCKKWNSICSSVHRKAPHFLFNLSSSSPPSSTSTSSNDRRKTDDRCHKLHESLLSWPVIINEPKKSNDLEVSMPPSFFLPKPDLLSNPNSSPNSASSSEASREMDGSFHEFKEYNSDNLNVLCTALEKKVSSQKEIIPDIVSTVLKCRAGVTRPRREDSWLLFSGADRNGKETVARELAKAVFGSYDCYVSINRFSHAIADRNDDSEVSNKRARNKHGAYERFVEGVCDNPHRVFYVEDVDGMECSCLKGFERGMREGRFTLDDGEVVPLKDPIVVLVQSEKTKDEEEDDDEVEEMMNGGEEEEIGTLDLNVSVERKEKSGSSERGVLMELVDKQVVFTIQVL